MTKDPMRLAKAIRKERGLQRQDEFAKAVNVSRVTLSQYENGKTYPQARVIDKFAELFHWDDEKRMFLMPEVKAGVPELSKKYIVHTQYLKLKLNDLMEVVGTSRTNVQKFRYNVPEKHTKKVKEFLKMDKEDVDQLLGKGTREPLDIDLIDKVLKRYEHLTATDKLPTDDPDVIKMRKNVGAL